MGPPGTPVTQAVADHVLATSWTGYSQAMASDDRAALANYTTPSALDASEATLDCGCLEGPLTYSTAIVSVPQQSGYPLSFLEGLSGTAYNQLSLTRWVVFTKSGIQAPWLISSVASFEGGGGLTGFTPFSSMPPLSVPNPLSSGPAAFAAFFQQVDMTGNAGSGVPPDFAQTNVLNGDVSRSVSAFADDQANGISEKYTHTVDQVSPVFPQVVDGSLYGSMLCFSMTIVDTVTSTTASPVTQPDSLARWGALVAPGSYAQIQFTGEHDVCLGEDSGGGITLLAEAGGNYQVSTTPG